MPESNWLKMMNQEDEDCPCKEIETIKEQLAEKEAMIDWLVSQLQDRCNNENMCAFCMHGYRFAEYDKDKCHNENWKEAAQEAVKKNDK